MPPPNPPVKHKYSPSPVQTSGDRGRRAKLVSLMETNKVIYEPQADPVACAWFEAPSAYRACELANKQLSRVSVLFRTRKGDLQSAAVPTREVAQPMAG